MSETPESTTAQPNVVTAFTVVIDATGKPNVIAPQLPEDIVPAREATLMDIRRAVLELSADIAAQAAAQYVLENSLGQQDGSDIGARVGAALAAAQAESGEEE